MTVRHLLLAALIVALSLLAACSSSDDGGPLAPTGPAPLAVADLAVTAGADGQLTLQWTSPALPAKAGGGIGYALRHTAPGREDDPWEAWTALPAPAADAEAGALHEHTVTGLEAGRTYALRLRARWNEGPWSEASNPVIATAAADHDRTRPAPVAGLRQWAAGRTWLTVAWAVAGDDSVYGTATGYEVRWSTAPIDEGNWAAAALHEGQVTPASKPGLLQITITGLADSTDHWVGVRAVDDAGLRSGLGTPLACLTDSMRIWYVNVEGTGDLPTIGAAVAVARVGDTVLVAPGRYTWANQGTGDPHVGLVYVPAYHTGFSIVGEAGPEATIIDAQGQGPCLFITGGMFGPSEDVPKWPGVTVDGFTLTGGRATGPSGSDTEAYVGAGLTAHLNSTTVRNCIIRGNEATEGGGLWYGGQGVVVLENLLIEDNRAQVAGGMLLVNDLFPVEIRNCTIRNNTAVHDGGGVLTYNVNATFTACVIEDNTSGNRGGGFALRDSNHRVTLQDVTIRGNTADHGGAAFVNRTSIRFAGVTMAGNTVSGRGGAVLLDGALGEATLDRCTIVGNSASLGSVFRTENTAFMTVTGSIIAGNTGGQSFAAHVQSGFALGCSDLWSNANDTALPTLFTDLGGIFRADPRFCGGADYRLRADSPCLPGQQPAGAEGCGPLGAHGQGCG